MQPDLLPHDSPPDAGLDAASSGDPAQATVLVVDLDGTLCRTDTLHEALLALLTAKPAMLPGIFRGLLEGKAAFKARVADLYVVPATQLPLNEALLDQLRAEHSRGRRIALVSASDHRQVEAVAAHCGLFEEAVGTGSPLALGKNLSGRAKADFLTQRYGARGFDYIGDAKVDLPVWTAAQRAITLNAGPGLRLAAEGANSQAEHRDPGQGMKGRFGQYLRAMRPHQWSKNLLVFLPMLAAHDIGAAPSSLIAFICFCLTASSVYLINDLIDLQADRAHPRKRNRPFAAGNISLISGAVLSAGLVVLAAALALLFTPIAFLGVLAFYYAATFAYSLFLKRKLIVDVLTLAGLYTLRIIAGATAASLVLSPWMLGFSMFLFLSLAAVKRQAELMDQLKDGRDKTAGRDYETEDLPVLRGIALSSGYAAVLVLALYISSPEIQRLYDYPVLLWLICPLRLYWISRMVLMTHRGYMTDDPIVYAATDRASQFVILITGLILMTAALW